MRVLEPAEGEILGVAARSHLEDDGPARDALFARQKDPADGAATELEEQHVIAEDVADAGEFGRQESIEDKLRFRFGGLRRRSGGHERGQVRERRRFAAQIAARIAAHRSSSGSGSSGRR